MLGKIQHLNKGKSRDFYEFKNIFFHKSKKVLTTNE